jgi:predicted phage terminase large subunit-like protein
MARQFNADGLLRGVIIEDKSSGKSARYTLQAAAPSWLRGMIYPFKPQGSKEARASAASVWCRNGMVLLPHPGEAVPWLLTFEDELFSFPQSAYADQVDAFGQGITFLENYLAEGYRARAGGRL